MILHLEKPVRRKADRLLKCSVLIKQRLRPEALFFVFTSEAPFIASKRGR